MKIFWKPIFLIILTVGVFLGCSSSSSERRSSLNSWMEENGKIKVLSTIEMISDLVEGIGKEHIDPLTLIRGELDPHSYELVKGDDEKVRRADVIFYNGLGLEHGATLAQVLKGTPKAISVGDWIHKKHPEMILQIDQVIDPHIWMDISLWTYAIEPITEALIDIDPLHAEEFKKNASELKEKLEFAHHALMTQLSAIPQEKRYLVTSHDAFHYFGRTYFANEKEKGDFELWHKRVQAPEGLAPESQLSTMDIKEIVEHLKEHDIHVIFPESNVSRDSIRKIVDAANKMGIQVEMASDPLYGDAMKNRESFEEIGYLQTLFYNADVLIRNLKE